LEKWVQFPYRADWAILQGEGAVLPAGALVQLTAIQEAEAANTKAVPPALAELLAEFQDIF
jgi:hypothetical protein